MSSNPTSTEATADDVPAVASPSRILEFVAAAAALAFFVVLLMFTLQLELRREPTPGQIDARQWPLMLAVLGIVLAATRLGIALVRPPDPRDDLEPIRSGGYLRLGITIALTLGYVWLWGIREQLDLGVPLFLIITPLLLATLVASYGSRSWKAIALYPVLLTGFAYLLFHTLLRIPL